MRFNMDDTTGWRVSTTFNHDASSTRFACLFPSSTVALAPLTSAEFFFFPNFDNIWWIPVYLRKFFFLLLYMRVSD